MLKTHPISLLLLVLLLVAPGSCDKRSGVSKFVSDKGQTYFELRGDRGLHKVYSQEADGSALIVILDKKNVPEAVALIADEKAYVVEYRSKQGVPQAGLKLLDASYMAGVNSLDPSFAQWRSRLAVFKVPAERRSKTFKLPRANLEPFSIQVNGNGITVGRLFDCQELASHMPISCVHGDSSEGCICAAKALCRAVDCYLRADRQCVSEELSNWQACPGFKLPDNDGSGEGRDIPVGKLNGIYNLAY